jgi:hypothetical protein
MTARRDERDAPSAVYRLFEQAMIERKQIL